MHIPTAAAQEPLVSIITVTLNSERTLRDTIESVLAQTYDRMEYLVVDGLSTDGTLAIARSYQDAFAARGTPYRIISERDNGIYDAMNKGIAAASGALIGMINSDDWYEKDAVEKAVALYRRERYDMMYADIRIVRGNSSFVKKARLRGYVTSRDWNHPTTFTTKTTYDRFRFACDSLYDDFDLLLRVRRAGLRVAVLNEVLANFRFGGATTQHSLRKAFRRVCMRYRIYRRNGYSAFYLFECLLTEGVKYLAS